ncbi:hypothetical protein [Nonomuraea guangzhouensis]|uniref:Uncharacterized protein n=1 Tax=Nonomuraea guangzhouensis TaxID=1291555 RepID=A0ABW4GJ71_9ACTN|nr:hypothetical protein [Nonomuraea guangzhouensis]
MNAGNLREAVRQTITRKRQAEEVGARLRAAGGASAAATALERLLRVTV